MPQDRSRLSGGVFHRLSVGEFELLLNATTLARTIEAIHLHHTWRPRHQDFKGAASITAMWRFHTEEQGWSDIAQHLTIDPEGEVWTGRHWEHPPASAVGFNGSSKTGPFMIEMIGDFDNNQDPFQDPQKATVLTVVALLLNKFALASSAIRFHNEMSSKSCPGTGIDKSALIAEVEALRKKLARSRKAPAESAASPFSSNDDALARSISFLESRTRAATRSAAPRTFAHDDGELPESDAAQRDSDSRVRATIAALDGAAREMRDVDVTMTAAVKDSLKPFVVNLTNGKFSTTGDFKTSQADVDAIFDEHLPKALAAAQSAGTPLRIVVYAHGGLVGEPEGLAVAVKHIDWWRANGVYPIYFAWETGLLSTLINVIRQAVGASRAADRAPDPLDVVDAGIEAAARRAQANRIWRDMKHVAELSSAEEGGARHVAKRLAALCQAHPGQIEVHAIGHSAGSNFHSFWVPQALAAGVPQIKTLQFFAPAVTVDGFFSNLAPVLASVGPLTIFTMKDSFEEDDNCARFYNKSLLYLIFFCLEDAREKDLLGLERSIRTDLRLKRMFGLEGTPSARGHEIVWSVTTGDRRSSSESVRHGGFDDDPATMNSALRRVLGLSGADEVPKEFVAPTRAVDVELWSNGVPADNAGATFAPAPADRTPVALGGTRQPRRALCVGINAYRRNPLNGCVADAERWAETLQSLGFEVEPVLRDEQATRAGILAALDRVIQRSASGDMLVFQYAGHGTSLPDIDGDEAGGDSPGVDEALCPYDFTEGRFIIDDDLAAVFAKAIDKGIQLTSFIDCCHSGTISRLGLGQPDGMKAAIDERPRFVVAEPSEIEAHRTYRASRSASRGVRDPRGEQRDVLFAACRSTEVAWESAGQGDFTRHATAILRRNSTMTNGAFLDAVLTAFGGQPRQHPELHPAQLGAASLFGGGSATPTSAPPARLAPAAAPSLTASDTATLLRTIADVISRTQ